MRNFNSLSLSLSHSILETNTREGREDISEISTYRSVSYKKGRC